MDARGRDFRLIGRGAKVRQPVQATAYTAL